MIDTERLWTRIELIKEASLFLEASSVTDALRNVEWMLCELLQCGRAQLYAYPDAGVSVTIVHTLAQMLERRAKYEPLQYILGHTEFYGLRIHLTPDVLIPRPETEVLVEVALKCISSIENPHVLDVGTGSGCIALAIKNERPRATVSACDVSNEALSIATANATRLNLQIQYFYCDAKNADGFPHPEPCYDLIISNPPYIPSSEQASIASDVKDYEPHMALFVENDPLEYYKSITHIASKTLHNHGYLCFETHSDYTHDVYHYVRGQGFGKAQQLNDLAGKPRIVIAQKGS